MPSSETIELRKVKGVVGEKTDLPSQNPRVSLSSRLRALQLRGQGIPNVMHLYGAYELNKTLTFNSGEDYVKSLFSDGTYLYAGLHVSPGKIIKIDLETFTTVSTLTLGSGEDKVEALFSVGDYLYAGLDVSPGKVVKIDLDTFTKVSTLTLSGPVFDMIFNGNNLYCSLLYSPCRIAKVDLSTFTEISTLHLDSGEAGGYSIYIDSSYLYCALTTTPGKVVKIDLNSFTKVSTLTLSVGANDIYNMSSDGNYIYVAMNTVPGKIVKIDLSTFTEVCLTTLATGENNSQSLLSDGTYLYTGLVTKPGKIVRQYILPTANLYEREIDLIHEQTHTGTHYVYPTLAPAVVLTSSATAWTMGSYTEIIPIVTIKEMFYLTGIVLNNMVIDSEYEVNIATGSAASEIVVGTVTHETNDTNLSVVFPISPPIKVSSRTRISARVATENAAADTCTIKLMYKT